MDSPRLQVDLEKELTCSICTELLYQPLTLLDCLHTFCGACLKEWFSWQAAAAETAPSPSDSNAAVYTCPSCRAAVRDTRHNATVATLLDMFLAANPDKRKDQAERDEMDAKYRPGEKVLRKLRDKSEGERRLEDEERRLVERVREMSLREYGADATSSSTRTERSRRRDGSEGPSSGARDRTRRHAGGPEHGLRVEGGEASRRHRSASRQTTGGGGGGGDQSPGRRGEERRHIEHQSSIRSLISHGANRDMTQAEIDREIELFARQIQEEGLLEGLDLDNLDLSNNDELSRKITEAYRRRQRQRSRHDEGARRSNASANSSHHSEPDNSGSSRLRVSSRQGRSRSSSQTGPSAEDRSRPPTSSGAATHLAVQTPPRPRRRTASGGRSATVPVGISQPEPRAAAARSQTDLSVRTSHTSERPAITSEGRSTSTPTVATASGSPTAQSLPFSARAAAAASTGLGIIQHPPEQRTTTTTTTIQPPLTSERTRPRPSSILVSPSLSSPTLVSPSLSSPIPSSLPPSPTHKPPPRANLPTRPPLYPEPSLICKRCQRPHIEYTLHYNCALCHSGLYNLCRDCYLRGRGCLHWFGFGYGAWRAWDRRRAKEPDLAPPHMLTANRYRPPTLTRGGADGRVTLTAQDPELRLESGTFCARCEGWTTRDTYWRCEVCNEGDWGFCGECVGTGRCCSHDLLGLRYVPPPPSSSTPPEAGGEGGGGGGGGGGAVVGEVAGRVSLQTAAEGTAIGPFRPVVVTAACEVCGRDVPPREERMHCYACPSSGSAAADGGKAGEWEVCAGCYARLEAEGRISPENGAGGWRRCLAGHRMAVVGFVEGRDRVLRRRVVRDWVGGRTLGFEEYHGHGDDGELQVCYWTERGQRRERLVTRDVAAAADADVGVVGGTRWTDGFPPDGGVGGRAVARWAWYPAEGAEDELMFPKGAEVREIEDVNGEWFHGVYMGAKGLFPAPYVVPVVEGS